MPLKKLATKIKNSLKESGVLKNADREKFMSLSKNEAFEVVMHLIHLEENVKTKKELSNIFLMKVFSNDSKLLLLSIMIKMCEKLNRS